MPSTYDVSLVVDRFELTDDNLDALFEILPDAVPAAIAGVTTISAPVGAADAEAGAFALVETITSRFPEVVAVRLDQDLVSIPDIAERTERSRESIRVYADGKRGPGTFPAPVGVVGDGIRVWPWAAVIEWFRDALDEELGERCVPPDVAAVVDACLAGRRRHLVNRSTVGWQTSAVTSVVVRPARVPSSGLALVS